MVLKLCQTVRTWLEMTGEDQEENTLRFNNLFVQTERDTRYLKYILAMLTALPG